MTPRTGLFIAALTISTFLCATETGAEERIRLATTTSTENSGLLKALNPPFEKKHGIRVDVIAVGTGKALELGRNGDADVVFVHSRPAEDKFIAEGHGVNRRDVMYNDFVILGSPDDPAGIKGAGSAAAALKKIASAGAPFVSRGDDSGTHKKEKALWTAAGVEPEGAWYLSVGQGMGASLTIADEKGAYILADRGTYLAYLGKIGLQVAVEGDDALFNPYGIMAVNPARWAQSSYVAAMAYIGWVTSAEGQKIIREFTIGGPPLFTPVAVP